MTGRRRTMASLDGPSDDGLLPPDPDALLEQRRAEIKEAAEKAAVEEPVLTDEEEDEVVDLVNAGCKESWPVVFNRKVHLRTLTIEEELKISEITKPYIGSDGYPRAYRTAVVAAAIRTIDGKLLFNPLSDAEFDQIIVKKYEMLLKYYPLAIDQIYARYRDMELELLALVEKLGKFSG
jgi:hypothetical protein